MTLLSVGYGAVASYKGYIQIFRFRPNAFLDDDSHF